MSMKINEKGFTLIEVMMALAIFSLMSIAAYKAIDGLMRVKERVGAENRQWQQVMLFLDRFELDVKQHANRPIRNANEMLEPAWLAQPIFTNQYGAQLSLSRFGDAQQSGYLMDTRRIGYRLNRGAIELIQWPSLDVTREQIPEVFEVLENVSDFKLKYLTKDSRWILSWPEVAEENDADALFPRAVSLELTMGSGEKIQRLIAL
jgi:general secretion pathway protein J